jgi:hypothetical protein
MLHFNLKMTDKQAEQELQDQQLHPARRKALERGSRIWCVLARVAQRCLYTAGWEGRGTSRSCDPKDPETTQLTRPLMTRK